jgi:hypothetical protein
MGCTLFAFGLSSWPCTMGHVEPQCDPEGMLARPDTGFSHACFEPPVELELCVR